MWANRGMFLESLLNRSHNYFMKNKIAIIHKRNLQINISEIKQQKVKGFLGKKSYVDYYGYYQNKFFEFDAKSTSKDYFLLTNIKLHQHQYLLFARELGAHSFLIIYFSKFKTFVLINYSYINEWYSTKKKISFEEIIKKGKKLKISFPGILNYLKFI